MQRDARHEADEVRSAGEFDMLLFLATLVGLRGESVSPSFLGEGACLDKDGDNDVLRRGTACAPCIRLSTSTSYSRERIDIPLLWTSSDAADVHVRRMSPFSSKPCRKLRVSRNKANSPASSKRASAFAVACRLVAPSSSSCTMSRYALADA